MHESFGVDLSNLVPRDKPAAMTDPVDVPPIKSNRALGVHFALIDISRRITRGMMPLMPPPSILKILILSGFFLIFCELISWSKSLS